MEITSVNIRPKVTILSVLRHLNYKPYYALAEFIDNALDSYIKYEKELKEVEGNDYKLSLTIEFNNTENTITIRDNAAGIHEEDYERAFRAAEIPPDNTQLSEFGMGMKSAACWFSNRWSVRTTALGEAFEREITLDIDKIVTDKVEELNIVTSSAPINSHYTVITLLAVDDKMPVKKSLWKVKRHLASIYRDFIRKGKLELKINQGDPLEYQTPKILEVPFFDTPKGKKVYWKQEVAFDFGTDHKGGKLSAKGFVAIMETMSVKDSGFALFRRGRVIEGSADTEEGFRPPKLMGSVGSHRYKRLFGELHLEGFEVSHTKDGFQWDDNMDVFLDFLKEELESPGAIQVLRQADRYRVRESRNNYVKVSQTVVDNTTQSIQENLPSEVQQIRDKPQAEDYHPPLIETPDSYFRRFPLELNDCQWIVHVEISYDDSITEFIEVGDHLVPEKEKKGKSAEVRNIGVRLSLVHPFMITFAGDNPKIIEPILRIAVGLGLSEVIARAIKAPVIEVRNNLNELLTGSLSKL